MPEGEFCQLVRRQACLDAGRSRHIQPARRTSSERCPLGGKRLSASKPDSERYASLFIDPQYAFLLKEIDIRLANLLSRLIACFAEPIEQDQHLRLFLGNASVSIRPLPPPSQKGEPVGK